MRERERERESESPSASHGRWDCLHTHRQFMCSGFEARSYLRLIDVVSLSSGLKGPLGPVSRVKKKEKTAN